MPHRDQSLLFHVAGSTRLVAPLGVMGEPSVAAAAFLVPSMPTHLGDIFLVTTGAKRIPHVAELELMGRVTLTATRFAVKSRFVCGRCVASRTGPNLREGCLHRMRVVTASAGPGRAVFRMVRMNVGMALFAACG